MNKFKNRQQFLVQILLMIGIILFINILSNHFYTQIDLTEEKKYTLTPATKKIVNQFEDRIYINVLLEGKFPAGFKRLQESVRDLLTDFRKINPNIEFDFENPAEGTIEEINARRKALSEQGIAPVNLRLMENDERTEKLIYPVAIINRGNRSISVNLLENEISGASPDENIYNSISLLEYKFASTMQKFLMNKKPIIMMTEGHGELDTLETMDLEITLSPFYNIGRLNLDNIIQISPEIDLLIIPRPRGPFTEPQKFKLDQYIMQGGKVMFFIDKLAVSLDSLQGQPQFVPREYDLNLDDQLFKYGARINPDLVMDLQCTRIPLAVGQQGNKPQLELFPWFYHLAITPTSNHPIVKNLDRINALFPNSIDTIRTSTEVKKTNLLTSSQYTRFQIAPMQLSFEILRYEVDPEKFNKEPKAVAVLLEGSFPSLYTGRVSESMMAGLNDLNIEFKESSEPTAILVVSDGGLIRNPVNRATGQYNSMGFNTFENYKFANKDFIINSIEYMLDEQGVLEARSKDVKLRLLDTVRAKSEQRKWQLINIAIPLVLLMLFGIAFNWWRKRKYASV